MTARDPYAPSAATLAGDNADIYFRRSCDILTARTAQSGRGDGGVYPAARPALRLA